MQENWDKRNIAQNSDEGNVFEEEIEEEVRREGRERMKKNECLAQWR
jgi:hypothetical protein